jgi:hypothetical protein
MTLQEFLATASSDNVVALQQARDYQVGSNQLIPATTVNQVLAQLNMTGVLQDIAVDTLHPARHKIASVLLSVQGNHDFNFIEGTVAGDGNLLMLDWLIGVAMVDYAQQLTVFKQTMQALANRKVAPFINTTLHDVLIVREQCPMKPVQSVGKFAIIETSNDLENHNPRLFAFNERLHRWQRVNSFYNVSATGKYEAEIPSQWINSTLMVDDAYGVINVGG